jgi:hypothetical protein
MFPIRCSFCFRPRAPERGVSGAGAFICAPCVAEAVKLLLSQGSQGAQPVHPSTEEFMRQFGTFREQLESDHQSREEHAVFESALERLESALEAVRKLAFGRDA